MTDKKKKILNAALELFAKEGFKATSTSKVARKAGVSEGLIFRHFENKDGLLNAIIKEGEEKAKLLFADVVLETDPKLVIDKTLNIGLDMIDNQGAASFWKLQYKIKWETEQYGEHKMEPLEMALTNAFEKLGVENPKMEAKFFLLVLDGLATRFYLSDHYKVDEVIAFIKSKYTF